MPKATIKPPERAASSSGLDKWFPSSKTCCKCGYTIKELQLKDREYICPVCGHAMGRDHQAAVNIDTEGMRIFLEISDMMHQHQAAA